MTKSWKRHVLKQACEHDIKGSRISWARIFFSLYNEDIDLDFNKEENSMIKVIIAMIVLVIVLKYSYGCNNKVRKNLESLEEIF